MSDEVHDDDSLRKYLLGELEEGAQRQVEESLLTDDELFKLLLVAEDDLIDDYVSETLSASERAGFEGVFLSSPERRRKLSFAMAFRRYVTAEGVEAAPRMARRSAWWKQGIAALFAGHVPATVIALGLIAVGIAVGTWRVFFYQSEIAKGTAALARAYAAERPVEARITGFGYAPLANTRGGDQSKVDELSLKRAELILLNEVAEHPSAGAHHALGRVYLAKKDYKNATEQFEEALKSDPNNAKLHSDYGAMLLEKGKVSLSRGESGKSLEEFARSDEHLSRALELDGSLIEALFNRALCKGQMLLYPGAEEDWKTYLQKDPSSRWADEARRRLQDIETHPAQLPQERGQVLRDFQDARQSRDDARAWSLICQSRDLTGSAIEDSLVDAFIDSATNGRGAEARQSLEDLTYAGETARSRSGDLFTLSLVRFYESLTPPALQELARAHNLIKSGREAFGKNNFNSALEAYSSAKEIFRRLGDDRDLAKMDFIIGNAYVQQSEAETGLSYFQPLTLMSDRLHFRFLLAQTLYVTSGALQYSRDFSAALKHTSRAITIFEEMGDVAGVLRVRFQLGEINRFVNNERKALDIYFQDLPRAREYFPQPAAQWARYFSISRAFDQLDLYSAAVDFQNEALRLAQQAKSARIVCRSQNYLGFILARHGRYSDAESSIERAIEAGNSLEEEKVRKEAIAYSFLQLGFIHRKLGDFNKAIENYDKAILSYDALNSDFFAFTARKGKLLCCMDREGCSSIDQELETMLKLFEGHRSKILEESNRNTFFDAEQGIYDMAIEFAYYKRGDSNRAFEYSERSRGRSLSDLLNKQAEIVDNPANPDLAFHRVSQEMGIEEIRQGLPAQSQILQFAVLKSRILIWVVSNNGLVSAQPQSIAVEELNKRVDSFRRLATSASETDLDAFARESMSLYDLLIKPARSLLDPTKELCIVPDKILNYLPFGALKSEVSGKYLIDEQQQGLVLSASSSIFIDCSEYAREKASAKNERLLVVGDPLFDNEDFPGYKRLESAAGEARAIARYYGSPSPLIGPAATKKRVMREMEQADVIHLATHAITDETYPMRSKLLLAKETTGTGGEDSGALQAYEIFKLDLARVKLVVLSACRTGVEKYFSGEGMIGLARPFIVQHIPLVVASLWPVDSPATARLMTCFQKHRKTESLPTAVALRTAQLEMLASVNSDDRLPRNWAAFVVIGGNAAF
jgi:CHAT domain-containing protein/Tfp pilus assembly protein PilF